MKKLLILSMACATVGAQAIVFNVDAGGPINDVSTNNFTFTLNSAITSITDINVRLAIQHTWDADLDIFLIAPDLTSVELTTDNGSSGDNFQDTLLDDAAGTSITTGTAPFAGTYRPEALLSAMNGKSANGVWTLRVIDDAGGDVGRLYKAGDTMPWGANGIGTQLIIEGVPEPTTMAALGLGVAAMLRRRRK